MDKNEFDAYVYNTMDAIDDAKKRDAVNDLSVIAYDLVNKLVATNNKLPKNTTSVTTQTFPLHTAMGRVVNSNSLPYDKTIIEKMSEIGYENSSNAQTEWELYLASQCPGKLFKIIQSKYDDGSYYEEYIIIEVTF